MPDSPVAYARITDPEAVRAAAAKIGAKLVRGIWAIEPKYDGASGAEVKPLRCCPLSALMLAENPGIRVGDIGLKTASDILGVSMDYAGGFICAVDGETCFPLKDHNPDFIQGYEDAKALLASLALEEL